MLDCTDMPDALPRRLVVAMLTAAGALVLLASGGAAPAGAEPAPLAAINTSTLLVHLDAFAGLTLDGDSSPCETTVSDTRHDLRVLRNQLVHAKAPTALVTEVGQLRAGLADTAGSDCAYPHPIDAWTLVRVRRELLAPAHTLLVSQRDQANPTVGASVVVALTHQARDEYRQLWSGGMEERATAGERATALLTSALARVRALPLTRGNRAWINSELRAALALVRHARQEDGDGPKRLDPIVLTVHDSLQFDLPDLARRR